MAINDLYKRYFQKSIWFLYPNLGIKRNAVFRPINTYIVFNDEIRKEDEKLIVLHEDNDSDAFRQFEKNMLFKNKFFDNFKTCVDNKNAYIFTFQECEEDWCNFLSGKYSRLSNALKKRIELFVGRQTDEWDYINSFLNPDKHIDLYATFLAGGEKDIREMQKILQEVGELCDPFNLEKESLKIELKETETCCLTNKSAELNHDDEY